VHNACGPIICTSAILPPASATSARGRDRIRILHELQATHSGFAVPNFVIDAPGGGGNVPFQYDYTLPTTKNEIVFENYLGKTYRYPEPQAPSPDQTGEK
jgi:lysine 2,3-aminomutase